MKAELICVLPLQDLSIIQQKKESYSTKENWLQRCLRRIILSCTKEGDTVLDPFIGSGTTSAVAKYYGRNSIGIDLNENYMEIIKNRLQKDQKTLSGEEPEITFEKFKE